ncbi:MAG: NTP transferase domain-containing protein [Flavobacteriales bacterium]|nr:NTP transferase domain-containing protein [Flavobacteriales bacterium]
MEKDKNYCVIMAGGIGSRFWPMSRTEMPKQFLDILGTGKSLIRQTFERFENICPAENVLVVTNAAYKDLVLEHIPELKEDQVLCEPEGRNTAPCIAYANYRIASQTDEAHIVVAPSDHLIADVPEFERLVGLAIAEASETENLVTLGITPTRPDTGYGYIHFEEKADARDPLVKKVKEFKEKPDLETAKTFVADGNYAWNSGIFIWSLKNIMENFSIHLPEMVRLFDEGKQVMGTDEEDAFIRENFSRAENISIDYGVLERAAHVSVIESDFGWSDLGTYGSLYTHLSKDSDKNAIVGARSRCYDSSGNFINTTSGKLVVTKGLEDFIVVETEKSLMIIPRSEEQFVKNIVNDLKADGESEFY